MPVAMPILGSLHHTIVDEKSDAILLTAHTVD